ncbi:uracil-DNA glycosylase [Sphingomonas radiodurans]|uniref:uracil-DNA glycosylase n=1 Tax=Sphingomonas radiodurans TaxID=2890321 RepID=UPI001E2BE16A|nr:uracil-DNA glycosylase [Sphingomonas radiodurans]WBH15903.1 uracil-DNA glycosylase [Sphingomonas radiodurans]
MGADQNHDWQQLAASALEWWRDAGVDTLVGDDPFDWLAAEEALAVASAAQTPPHARAAAPTAPQEAAALPQALDAFLAWRTGQHAPESSWGVTLVSASGPIDADLMILVDCPERDEGDSLLRGAAGRLFDRMLAAIGRSRADVYLASVCAARPTAGRMPRDIEARLGEIARHHAGLAGPRRLLVLGDAASRAILAANVMEARGRLQVLNYKTGTSTEVVASFHPRMLLERPTLKAEAWKDLQMLSAGMGNTK